ncbi:MAG: phosphoribosylformylglycinamidine cyclo-ligase [Armatimonadota bacterium]
MGLTYKEAGVDINAAERAVELMKEAVRGTHGPEVIAGLSDFGGMFALDGARYREPVLVSGTDSVGTKLKLAFAMDKHDTVGQDAVAMCVNDILTLGARPLFFLDYIGCNTLVPEQIADVVAGVARACKRAGCALVGGETAELGDMYQEGEYDLVGFAVGVVERGQIVDGSKVRAGDALIGLTSSGLHSNGFTLVRKVFLEKAQMPLDQHVEELGRALGEELLEPTRVYAPAVVALCEKLDVHGLAHITGGGIPGNVARMIPDGLSGRVDSSAWPRPPIFDLLQRVGQIEEAEMYRTFNMGLGMVVALPEPQAAEAIEMLAAEGVDAGMVGRVDQGQEKAKIL